MSKSSIVRGSRFAVATVGAALGALASCGGGDGAATSDAPSAPASGAPQVDAATTPAQSDASACSSGTTRCSGDALQTCEGSSWGTGVPCAPGACVSDGVASAHCTAADGGSDASSPIFLVVLSAFPAEMAPIVAQATVKSTQVVNGHTFSVGTLKGVPVAMGITGMGLGNATATAHAALAQFPATGVVFSGTAGSLLRIGDVAVPTSWSLKGTTTYAPDAAWLALATQLMASGSLCLEKCTVVPASGQSVCMDHVPGADVAGVGRSDDVSVPVACTSGGDDVFGCDVGTPQGPPSQCSATGTTAPPADAGAGPIVSDNETAAVAAEAQARGVPFIGFRGVSDGPGDPLGLPGYPTEFFAYYRLAARNSAATAMAFIERVGQKKP
jgi:nucleoside phosphorylase